MGRIPPTVTRRSHFSPRTLFCIIFKTTGPVLIYHVDRGDTINHRYYIDNCLEPLIEEIRKHRSACGTHTIKLYHDNVGPHMYQDVVNYLESEDITIIHQPVNSPDLAPCEFCLFDLIKQNLSDQDSLKLLHRAIIKIIHSIDKKAYKKTFDKWLERMYLCVNNQDKYFEHSMK